MNIKKWSLINNVLFYVGLVLGIGVLAKTYFDRLRLPEGVCPLENNNGWILLAIIILMVSFLSGVVFGIYQKKMTKKRD